MSHLAHDQVPEEVLSASEVGGLRNDITQLFKIYQGTVDSMAEMQKEIDSLVSKEERIKQGQDQLQVANDRIAKQKDHIETIEKDLVRLSRGIAQSYAGSHGLHSGLSTPQTGTLRATTFKVAHTVFLYKSDTKQFNQVKFDHVHVNPIPKWHNLLSKVKAHLRQLQSNSDPVKYNGFFIIGDRSLDEGSAEEFNQWVAHLKTSFQTFPSKTIKSYFFEHSNQADAKIAFDAELTSTNDGSN